MHAASVVLQVDLGEKWRGLGDHLAGLAFPDGVEMPDVERQARRPLAQLVAQLRAPESRTNKSHILNALRSIGGPEVTSALSGLQEDVDGWLLTEVRKLLVDVGRIDERVDKLQTHFRQAQEDIGKIRTSTNKVASRGEKIELIELGEGAEAEEISAGAEIHTLERGNS